MRLGRIAWLAVSTREARFQPIEGWLFDLDNTLYPYGSAVLLEAEQRICRFIEERFRLSKAEAWQLQKNCLAENGSTLAGLIERFAIDPEPYLAFVNDVDVTTLAPAPELKDALDGLPGKRAVFTNNCAHYAERVLDQLGIEECFDAICDIRTTGFAAKPTPSAYRAVVIAPAHCAMFEDAERNLAPAHALGMTTVWLQNPGVDRLPLPSHVHHDTDDLARFLQSIKVRMPS
jgi:putative hydrolase of the HAD superfamily